MKKIFGLSLFILSLSFVLTSCGKLPQTEIDTAKAVVDSATTVGADKYLPEEFMAIQDSLKSALEIVEAQKSKFLFKNFDVATKKLQEVKAMADQAIANTEVKKVQVKEEAQAALVVLDSVLTEDKALIVKAPKGKEGKAALDEITAELTVVEGAVAETNSLIESGDFIGARDKVVAAKEKAIAINTELKEAIAKTKGRK